MTEKVLLGDEAVALAAIHAGITAAYAYPGTPSTEILEYIQRSAALTTGPHASWCVNEKTAYEQALGVSLAGRRVLVSMKHVGLNVAADPFVNSALVAINGGLVLAVADDPGMHSSQNEQDSRLLADFARIICLEPGDQQEAYTMTHDAFALSERFGIPVMVRLVTRLAHSRAAVSVADAPEPLASKALDTRGWILLPALARRRWRSLLDRQAAFQHYTETHHNTLRLADTELGVVTAGVGRNYFFENRSDLGFGPSHLHIGAYPLPVEKIRALVGHVRRILVLEDGYPYIERAIRGLLSSSVVVLGRETTHLPPDGELTPDTVRVALGLKSRPGMAAPMRVPDRPPQLCAGCPHTDAFQALETALDGWPKGVVTSDIGCYTLGALPPLQAIETCVCMGASIGMAKGASDAGIRPAIATIGDSTFLHSGIPPLIDAIAADTDMTVIILDNEVVAMTGAQPTLLPSSRLKSLLLGLGVPDAHCHVVPAHPRHHDANAALIRQELAHPGLSVIVAVRECVEALRARKVAAKRAAEVMA